MRSAGRQEQPDTSRANEPRTGQPRVTEPRVTQPRTNAGVGVRPADIDVGRMNITPRRMDISQPRMNITPRRMNTMPDYKGGPVVVTPRQPDRSDDGRSGRGEQGGIRPSSPNRIVPPRSDDRSGGDGRDSRGEGRSRGDGRGGNSDWNRGGRDDSRDSRDSSRDAADRLRDQRDRNTRDANRDGGRDGGRDSGRDGGRGDWNGRRDDDRRDDDRHDGDRHDRDWGRDDHGRYDNRYRGYLVSRPRDYYIHDRPVYRYTGSGLYIRGGYLGDRWSIDARLSSGVFGLDCYRPGYFCPSTTWLTCDRGWVGGHWNGYYWSSFDWPYGYPSSNWVQRGQYTDFTTAVPASEAVVVERDVRMDEMQSPTIQMPVPVDESGVMTGQSLSAVSTSPLDDGLSALMQGDPARGADELRVHLREHRDDGRALRLLSVALEESGEPVDAAAVMRMAHEMDPALATESLGLAALGYDDARMRDMVDKAVIHAHRVNAQHSTEAASAWLTVAVLMREQGRDDLAREMIKRARRAGLRENVVDSIELAWR